MGALAAIEEKARYKHADDAGETCPRGAPPCGINPVDHEHHDWLGRGATIHLSTSALLQKLIMECIGPPVSTYETLAVRETVVEPGGIIRKVRRQCSSVFHTITTAVGVVTARQVYINNVNLSADSSVVAPPPFASCRSEARDSTPG